MTGARDAPKLVRAPRDEVSEEASEVFPAEVSQLDVIATWSIHEDAADAPVGQVSGGHW